MKMMGIGKHRFMTLSTAARNQQEHCPFDLRFIPKGPQNLSLKRQKVHGFLLELYEELAEPIPDGWNSNKRPRRGHMKLDPSTLRRDKIKHLPAGSIADYWRQCKASIKDETVSKKLFSDVPWFC